MDDQEYINNPLTTDEVEVHPMTISDDEASADSFEMDEDDDNDWLTIKQPSNQPYEFDLEGKTLEEQTPPTTIIDEEERLPTPTAELLQLHNDFGHIPFSKLQEMAKQGVIPKRLSTCKVPICSACSYAKATKRPWRSRTVRDRESEHQPSRPGVVVSVDQLVSPTPGLIPQMTGFITKKQYKVATVYIDQATSFGYVYRQQSSSAEETLESKVAFKQFASAHGVSIKAYHADYGIFKAKAWVAACEVKVQTLTFAAVEAHHTSGKAE
jgi:hypothetical protein